MKPLPHSIEAEQSLIGSLIKSDKIGEAIGLIEAQDFYKERHQIVFSTMLKMFTENKKIDIITLLTELKNINVLEKVGGITYLTNISSSALESNIKQYAEIVKEKSNKRKIIKIAVELTDKGYNDSLKAKDVLDSTEDKLFKISTNNEEKMTAISKLMEKEIDDIEKRYQNGGKLVGIPTGFGDLDNRLCGLNKSDLIILAARPSMGKTTLALNIAQNVSVKYNVAVFSLEMSREQLVDKILAAESKVDLLKIRTGQLEGGEWEKIGISSGKIANRKLYIDDTAGVTINEIKAKCKKLKAQKGLDVVVIDYLQLIEGKGESRTQVISSISMGLKRLAKELDITVIALSQLSRAVEQRADKRPMLSDLRESGSIEQDADIVMFLYRDEYYNKESEDKNIAEVITAKNRNGKVGTVKLAWLGQYSKFGNLDIIHQ